MWRANVRLLDCSRSLMHTHNSKTRQLISSSLCHKCAYLATASAAQPAGHHSLTASAYMLHGHLFARHGFSGFQVDFDSMDQLPIFGGTPVPLG